MSGFKGMMKDGWHPKNESWRGDFKGINQVAGLMGKGRETGDRDVSEHVSQPMSSLKDPSSFGPPPKNRGYYGADSASSPSIPARSGSGASFSQTQAQGQNHQLGQQQTSREEQPEKPAPPAVPYRADRTGLSTSNLPPPPRRMDSPADSAPPVNSQSRPVPALPPRVPPRKDPSPPPAYTPIEPSEPSDGYINQGATSRLAQRGVSVPSLGIGKDRNSPSTGSPTTPSSGRNAVNDLQSRFSQMRTNSASSGPPPPPSRGTSTAEKQAALRTAQNAHRDPSSVSASDARSAASTVNNFRERHGDQIKAGKDKISGINQKYGISKKFNSFVDEHKPGASTSQTPPPPPSNSNFDRPASTRKKAPPPPPPKKAEMRASPVTASPSSPAPPPLPLSTKPR